MWNTPMYNTTKLTLELRELVESGVDLWDFEYPSYYKGEEKTAFEKKVIDHYFFRQIGSETVGRFLHQFRTKIREIMPYYIQMYKSVEIMDAIPDPFGNVDITETFKQTSSGSASGTTTGETSGTATGTDTNSGTSSRTSEDNKENRFSDTPQGSVENLDDGFLTNFTKDNADSKEDLTTSGSGSHSSEDTRNTSSETSSQSSETLEHTFTKKGNQGVNTYAHDMIEYRQSFINVDMMVIAELNSLFLGVY